MIYVPNFGIFNTTDSLYRYSLIQDITDGALIKFRIKFGEESKGV